MTAKIEDLRERKEAAYNAGSPRSVERQHEKGKMLARERMVQALVFKKALFHLPATAAFSIATFCRRVLFHKFLSSLAHAPVVLCIRQQ